jgi:hypothetical protein
MRPELGEARELGMGRVSGQTIDTNHLRTKPTTTVEFAEGVYSFGVTTEISVEPSCLAENDVIAWSDPPEIVTCWSTSATAGLLFARGIVSDCPPRSGCVVMSADRCVWGSS